MVMAEPWAYETLLDREKRKQEASTQHSEGYGERLDRLVDARLAQLGLPVVTRPQETQETPPADYNLNFNYTLPTPSIAASATSPKQKGGGGVLGGLEHIGSGLVGAATNAVHLNNPLPDLNTAATGVGEVFNSGTKYVGLPLAEILAGSAGNPGGQYEKASGPLDALGKILSAYKTELTTNPATTYRRAVQGGQAMQEEANNAGPKIGEHSILGDALGLATNPFTYLPGVGEAKLGTAIAKVALPTVGAELGGMLAESGAKRIGVPGEYSPLVGLAGSVIGGGLGAKREVAAHAPEAVANAAAKTGIVPEGAVPGAGMVSEPRMGQMGRAESTTGRGTGRGRGTSAGRVQPPLHLPRLSQQPLSQMDRLMNTLKSALNMPEKQENAHVTSAMRDRKAAQQTITSQARSDAAVAGSLVHDAFPDIDATGRITSLPGSPTIQDLAAKLPRYVSFLTSAQSSAMGQLRQMFAGWRPLYDEVGLDVKSRPDVEPGGFYLPRGRADLEGADSPYTVESGGRRGSRTGAEKHAQFDSMVEGIEEGYRYAPFEQVVESHIRTQGNRVLDQHVANFLKSLTDDEGNPLGSTAGSRVSPEMRQIVDTMRGRIKSLSGRLATAERRSGVTASKETELTRPLEKLNTVLDRPTARQALGEAQRALKAARADAVATARRAGKATGSDQAALERLSRAEKALNSVQTRIRAQMGYGDVQPTGMGVRLPAIESDAVRAAVNDAVETTREVREMLRATSGKERTSAARADADAAAQSAKSILDTAARTATDAASDLAPDAVFTAMRQMQRRIDVLRARGGRWAGEAENLRKTLDATQQQYEDFLPKWTRALEDARPAPRGEHGVGLTQLQGASFPDAVANVVNRYLNAEKPNTGEHSNLVHFYKATNNLLRGIKASSDVSFMGINGLLGASHDPAGYARAMLVAYKAIGDPRALGAYIRDFDAKAVAKGLPTSRQYIAQGLHVGGADTEFAIRGNLLRRFGDALSTADIPGTKLNPIRGSNRMFGYFGDTFRLELAQQATETAIKHGFNVRNPAVLKEITAAANRTTGWSPNSFLGSTGQLVEFAPRFLQSQLEVVAKAATNGSIEGMEARRMLLKLIGIGTMLTVAANEAQGEPISWKQLFNVTRNHGANFMRIRIGGQDISLFGPWDSLVKAIVQVAQGNVTAADALSHGDVSGALAAERNSTLDVARGKSAPLIGAAWDLLTGATLTGERGPGNILRDIMLPFSVSDLGQKPLSTTAIGLTGLKATPLSPTEELDQIAQAQFGKDFYDLLSSQQQAIKAAHPDLYERKVERSSAAQQQYNGIKKASDAEQLASDNEVLGHVLTREEWREQLDDRRNEAAGAAKAIYGDSPITNPRNAQERWVQAIQENEDPSGKVNWDAVDAAVATFSPADQAWIADHESVGNTPLVQKYKIALAQRQAYYDLPVYRGYTGDEAQQMAQLYSEARSNTTRTDEASLLASLRKVLAALPAGQQPPAKVVSGTRKLILGMLTQTNQRKRYAAQHPLMTAFFGGNGKSGYLTPAEVQLLEGS